jgi:hypothetical protein
MYLTPTNQQDRIGKLHLGSGCVNRVSCTHHNAAYRLCLFRGVEVQFSCRLGNRRDRGKRFCVLAGTLASSYCTDQLLPLHTPKTKRMNYIEELREAIRHMHGADATHVASVPVKETHQGRTVWEGIVEVFDLHGHPKATRAYAWSHETDAPGRKRHVAVLHLGPVVSAETAVRAAIVQEFKLGTAEES